MEDVEADDYCGGYDIGDFLNQNMRYNGYYKKLDKESVVDTICERIKEDVEQFVESYLEPSEPEYDYHERDYDYGIAGEMDVLDCIFK